MAVNNRTEDRTLLNFHPQATCADIMRRAVALMADRGVAICEIVHDAVVVEDAAESLTHTVEVTKSCWREASLQIIGFELDADARECTYDAHYEDGDGKEMWDRVMGLLAEAEQTH